MQLHGNHNSVYWSQIKDRSGSVGWTPYQINCLAQVKRLMCLSVTTVHIGFQVISGRFISIIIFYLL